MGKEQINAMGTLNNRWGVCGFTSSLYALYENSTTSHAELTGAAKVSTRVIAEIKSFLRQLQADGDLNTLNGIGSFTRTFDGYSGFTIPDYISRIGDVAANGLSYAKGDFSIAMPPEAVVAYLRYIGFRNAKVLAPTESSSGMIELILGFSDPKREQKPYKGLGHYAYQKDKTIYSWARQFSVNNKYKVFGTTCVIISPQG